MGKEKIHAVTCVVIRNNAEESTVAIVMGFVTEHSGIRMMSDCRDVIRKAVTEWMKETVDGKTAWRDSHEDFNVGDLRDHLYPGFAYPEQAKNLVTAMPESLEAHLWNRGFRALSVQCVAVDELRQAWEYDDVLVEGGDLGIENEVDD